MGRNWYLRLALVIVATVVAWFALWPSLHSWLPTPQWVRRAFPGRISPGLDIQGGLRLAYEVEVEEAIRERRDRLSEALLERLGEKMKLVKDGEPPSREQLQKVRQRVRIEAVGDRQLRLVFRDGKDAKWLSHGLLKEEFPDLVERQRNDLQVLLAMRDDQLDELRKVAIDQTVKTISNRIDELQIRETTVIGRDSDLIVEVPGADESMFDHIRSIIGRTARLHFKVLDDEGAQAAATAVSNLPAGVTRQTEVASAGADKPQVVVGYLSARGNEGRAALQKLIEGLPSTDEHQMLIGRDERPADEEGGPTAKQSAWRTYYVFRATEVTGEDIKDAFVSYDAQEGNKPYVAINFNSSGADRFERLTGRNVKRRMAIVLDDRVESAPVIQQKIGGGQARITLGSYQAFNTTLNEAKDLALVLRAGALPAPIRPANEQLIGPTLGSDSVQQGLRGALYGILLVLAFMLLYYQVAGAVAGVMVLLNILFLLAILGFLEATLTLPGIAGIALTVGMAVDANVLITERMREELRLGKSPRAAVDQGFQRAFSSIFDSQLTTFIAGVVLFQYGTGPIKGFAVTLMIGIVTSLFTGVFCSKVAMDWLVRGLRVKQLRVG